MRSLLLPSVPDFGRPSAAGSVIATMSPECLQDVVGPTGSGSGAATASWPATNRALFFPFEVYDPKIATLLAWYNGTSAAGNVDIGIYDLAGNRLVSSGSTAQTGTISLQSVDIADTKLAPGVYFLAMARDGTNSLVAWSAIPTETLRTGGVQQMASAFPLPATATFANPATAYLPWAMVAFQAVV